MFPLPPLRAVVVLRWTLLLATGAPLVALDTAATAAIDRKLDADYPALKALYRELHAHPELSLHEAQTSARLAAELRAAGCEVTEKFGGFGVVAVLKNGAGPTLLIRSDMDALPVREETGLTFASTVRVKDAAGNDVPVMHACGHDVHMTILTGTARELAALKEHWSGTAIFIGQPAEEIGAGAQAMLDAGLYRKFGVPDFAVALHDSATLAVGTLGTVEGFIMANVDSVDITVRGVGGHGAAPQATKDPVVLAARIVLALQTIVSRELKPTDPAVVTVGSIHGGTKHNIIPDEVKLQLTVRSFSDEVRTHILDSIRRICRGEAIAAGIPEERMPVVTVDDGFTPSVYNDPALTRRVHATLAATFGAAVVKTLEPETIGEDFSRYGRTPEHVPICLFRLGAVAPEKIAESERTGVPLSSLHSSKFAPVAEPTIRTGVKAMTSVALDLLGKK
jgi:hippurate hydrolase